MDLHGKRNAGDVAGNARPNRKLKNRITISYEEITERLKSGEMQLHRFPLGFVITEIKQLSDERIVHVVWLGGERFSEWADEVVAHLKKFGKENGCRAVEAHARPGLALMLRPKGFRELKRTIRAEV